MESAWVLFAADYRKTHTSRATGGDGTVRGRKNSQDKK